MDEFDDTNEITIGGDGTLGTGRVLSVDDIIGGTYRLKSLLGKGGMGYVFCAEHITFKRDFALKILAPEQLSPERMKRFVNEGRAIAALNHPNIVKVYDMALDQGEYPFYVMDLLAGRTLAESIASGDKFSHNQLIEIFEQIADGLAYAHSKGIVHRDVKPSNIIFLSEDRGSKTIKLVDFGIAKLLESAGFNQQSMTATGVIFGSPYYMSPEQCSGGTIDARSDIYSAGCTFFELLSGKPPFCGASPLATVMMHQSTMAPRIVDISADLAIPEEFESMVAKMLAKRPEDRYQNMTQVRHDLERIKEGKSIGKTAGGAASPDNQLDGDEQDVSSTSVFGLSRLKLLSLIASGVSIAAAACWYAQRPAPVHKIDTSTEMALLPAEKNVTITDKELMALNESKAPDIAQARKDYDSCSRIYSTRTIVDGKMRRIFYCPKSTIGNISINGDTQHAQGKVIYPDRDYASLIANAAECAAIDCPEIFEKIGVGEIGQLELAGHGKGADGAKNLTRILSVADKWTRLEELSIAAFDMTDSVIESLTRLPELKRLRLALVNWKGIASKDSHFWKSLEEVRLLRVDHVGDTLDLLAGSDSLLLLQLDSIEIPLPQLEALSANPKLKKIQISNCEVNDNLIETIGKLKNLRTIVIDNAMISLPQLKKLESYPNLLHIKLKTLEGSQEQIDMLRKNSIRTEIFD